MHTNHNNVKLVIEDYLPSDMTSFVLVLKTLRTALPLEVGIFYFIRSGLRIKSFSKIVLPRTNQALVKYSKAEKTLISV